MKLSVRRWTQRQLLYPLAIFAIIAPTVVMALFGTYALRETVLAPADYRKSLTAVHSEINKQIEGRMGALQAIAPPRGAEDLPRALADVDRYFTNEYTRTMAQQAFVGVPGRIEAGLDVRGMRDLPTPPTLHEKLASIRATPGGEGMSRELLTTQHQHDDGMAYKTYSIYIDLASGGFVAWELAANEIIRIAGAEVDHYNQTELGGSALRFELLNRETFRWDSVAAGLENKDFVIANEKFLPERYLVLRMDTGVQFTQNDQFLSNIYILIAVLCVPIVASATLMVVHMILREASEARKKVDFVSNVTHELKTPLTSIRMFVETLKLGRVKDPEKVQACLDTIMNETQRLGALIDHVLSFSKVENQVKKYNVEENDLAQVVIDTINLFKAQGPGLRDRVQRRILAGLPSSAMFDKDAIREVLLNLLTNAVKYSPGEKPIVVTAGANEKELFVAVQDLGIGIDQQFHNRIFEKFFRVDEDLARNVDGTGLGLAIVAEIVKAHGGRITVDSALGRGSTFTVYLPWKHGHTVVRRKTTRVPGGPPSEVTEPVPEPESARKPASDRQPVNARLLVLLPAALLVATSALAQPEPDGGDQPAEPKKEEASSLRERPESDPAAESWVKKLGGLRPKAVSVQAGVIVGHCLSPDGDRLYYYRPIVDPSAPKPDPKAPKPAVVKPLPPTRYSLYVVGPDKPESKLLDTGCACEPPLFLPDGRLALVQRLADTDADGEVSALDEAALVVCNREGSALRHIAALDPGALPVGVWREGAEILVSQAGFDDPNGWISSVNLVKGTSEKIVQAFAVSVVLPGDKLLIERLVAPPPPPERPGYNPWQPQEPETQPEQPLPTLLDPPEHLVYDPADGSVSNLHATLAHSRIVCQGEGSYFGHQLPHQEVDPYGRRMSNKPQVSQILIIDDAQHRETRPDGSRFNHYALAWVKERGLLVLQTANLRSKVMLLDRALKWHTLGELDLSARAVRVSPDGLKLCWLEVEDTDENGLLEPWKDHSRPFFAVLE